MASNFQRHAQRQLARGRLPSLRHGVDLTLGGSTRKKFTPNIPVANSERNVPSTSHLSPNLGDKGSSRRGQGGRMRGERGGRRGGRGRAFIQSEGSIFAGGPGHKLKTHRSSHGDSGSKEISKPKIDAAVDFNYVREEEENTIRELTRDDFIDDGYTGDADERMHPVNIVMRRKKVDMTNVKMKTNSSPIKRPAIKNDLKIKSEPPDVVKMEVQSDEDDIETKLRQIMPDDNEQIGNVVTSTERSETINSSSEIMPADVFSRSSSGELVMIQVPDISFAISNAMEKMFIKQEPGVRSAQPEEKPQTTNEPTQADGLANCQDGLLGKIQLFKSGRAYIAMKTCSLELDLLTNCENIQNAVLLDCEDTSGNFADLGPIVHNLVCRPKMKYL